MDPLDSKISANLPILSHKKQKVDIGLDKTTAKTISSAGAVLNLTRKSDNNVVPISSSRMYGSADDVDSSFKLARIGLSSVEKSIREEKEEISAGPATEKPESYPLESMTSDEATLYRKTFHGFTERLFLSENRTPNEIWKDIRAARSLIREITNHWESILSTEKETPFTKQVAEALEKGRLVPMEGGMTGTYKLVDEWGSSIAVVKPFDEELQALNNPKGMSTPFLDEVFLERRPVKVRMYQTAQNAALAYRIAEELKIEAITPEARLMMVASDKFYDIADGFSSDGRSEQEAVRIKLEYSGKNKLCSVQSVLTDVKELETVVLESTKLSKEDIVGLSKEDLKKIMDDVIDHDDASLCNVFAIIIGECDGNAGNYLVSNQTDEKTEKRKMWKIDNAVAFPVENADRMSSTGISWSPHNNERPLSPQVVSLCEKINDPEIKEKIKVLLIEYGKTDDEIEETMKRITYLGIFASGDYKEMEFWKEVKDEWALAWGLENIDEHELTIAQLNSAVFYYASP